MKYKIFLNDLKIFSYSVNNSIFFTRESTTLKIIFIRKKSTMWILNSLIVITTLRDHELPNVTYSNHESKLGISSADVFKAE